MKRKRWFGAAKRPPDYRCWALNRVDYTFSGRNRLVRISRSRFPHRPGPPAIHKGWGEEEYKVDGSVHHPLYSMLRNNASGP